MSDRRESPPLGGLATLTLLAFVQAMATPRWRVPLEQIYETTSVGAIVCGAVAGTLLLAWLGLRCTLGLAFAVWFFARLGLSSTALVVYTEFGPTFDASTTQSWVLDVERFAYHACLAACLIGAARFATRVRGGALLGVALVWWAATAAPIVSLPTMPLAVELGIVLTPAIGVAWLRPPVLARGDPPVALGASIALVLFLVALSTLHWSSPQISVFSLLERLAPLPDLPPWVESLAVALRASYGLGFAVLVVVALGGAGPSAACRRRWLALVALGVIGATLVLMTAFDLGSALLLALGIGVVQGTAYAILQAIVLSIAITRGGAATRAAMLATAVALPYLWTSAANSTGWTFYTPYWVEHGRLGSGGWPLWGIYSVAVALFVALAVWLRPSNDDGVAQVDDPVESRESDRRD